MYNVGFGDCFCIRDRKSSLLVDFGAANSKIEGRPRREVFDVIISDPVSYTHLGSHKYRSRTEYYSADTDTGDLHGCKIYQTGACHGSGRTE